MTELILTTFVNLQVGKYTVRALSRMFFLEFLENFHNSYVKEPSYFYAVGALKEMDGLLKDLISSA